MQIDRLVWPAGENGAVSIRQYRAHNAPTLLRIYYYYYYAELVYWIEFFIGQEIESY
jgi:hypothetical protein